jgi:hypothetical protein
MALQHEALFTSVVGAAPTLLVAYVVEDRFLAKRTEWVHRAIKGARLVILVGCFISFLVGMVVLAQGDANPESVWVLIAAAPLMMSFGGFIGILTFNLGFYAQKGREHR